MRDVVIVSCARTAIGQFGQSLKDVPVVQLGGIAIKEAIKRTTVNAATTATKLSTVAPPLRSRPWFFACSMDGFSADGLTAAGAEDSALSL